MLIPEPNFFHPGSRIRIFSIPDPVYEFFPSRMPYTNFFHPGCRIRIFSIPDTVYEFFPSRIPYTNFFHPGSRSRIKEFKYFNPKNCFLALKYDPGCSSRIRILIFYHPGYRIKMSKRHRIRIWFGPDIHDFEF
jgi:hypothetical protein